MAKNSVRKYSIAEAEAEPHEFCVMAWASVKPWFDEIERSLSAKFKVLGSATYEFTEDKFDDLMFEMYETDGAQRIRIVKKLEYLKPLRKVMRVVFIKIPQPRFRRRGSDGKPVSTVVEQIKSEYRTKYSKRIVGYFHDVVMHISDNYTQTRQLRDIFRKACKSGAMWKRKG